MINNGCSGFIFLGLFSMGLSHAAFGFGACFILSSVATLLLVIARVFDRK